MIMSTNALFIDYEFCSGCHSCELACRNELGLERGEWGIKLLQDGPRQFKDGTWHWDYIILPSEKCDLCASRVKEGLQPACVQTCQAKVLEYGSVAQLAQKMAEKGHKVAVFIP